MDKLRVRMYNVRFGDAILVSVPERDARGHVETRHMLIDLGNAHTGEGGEDVLFRPVIENVLAVLAGRPLDLYVMTHEHMDHVQGLLYGKERLGLELPVRYAWLTASAAEDYYERHPEAKKQRLELLAAYEAIATYLQAAPEAETPWVRVLMWNNNPRRTADCVAYLRGLAKETAYVYRGCDLAGKNPFREAEVEILAPEEDTAEYYGRFQPMALHVTRPSPRARPEVLSLVPPPGVDAGAFFNLVDFRRRGFSDNLLAIDRAANNTSVVLALRWRGWKLLFAGDAELRSWKTMEKHGVLAPVHFLKVSHHGSHNGTPREDLLEKILPETPPGERPRLAAVSAYPGTYSNVPDEATLEMLRTRTELREVESLPDGSFVDLLFEDLTHGGTSSKSCG